MQTKHVLIVMGALGLLGASYYFLFMRDGSPVAAGSTDSESSDAGTSGSSKTGVTLGSFQKFTSTNTQTTAKSKQPDGKTVTFEKGETVIWGGKEWTINFFINKDEVMLFAPPQSQMTAHVNQLRKK